MPIITSSVQLLFGEYGTKSIGGISIDAFVEETHDESASVTSYPIEDGTSINDHVIQNPEKLTISGVISANTVYLADILEYTPFHVVDVYWNLVEMKEEGLPITVVTGLRVYSDMVIESISIPRNSESGKSLYFSMSLVQVRIVTSQTVTINTEGTQPQANQNIGSTNGKNPSDADRPSFIAAIKAGTL
jgi:hypothetical protein